MEILRTFSSGRAMLAYYLSLDHSNFWQLKLKVQEYFVYSHLLNVHSTKSIVSQRGGANPSIVPLKQGVWGAQPPEAMGCLILFSAKIPYDARLECF